MRPHDAAMRTLLGSSHFNVHLAVEVQNGSGTWVNYAAVPAGASTLDFVDGATIQGDVDTPVESATVTLRRDLTLNGVDYSLAPLLTASGLNRDDADQYAPALNPGRQIRIRTAVVGPNAPTFEPDWRWVFWGKVDDVSWADQAITLQCRDVGAYLLDAFIEVERVYGDEAGVAVETVIQAILDDTLGDAAPTLTVPVSPTWLLKPYRQERVSVFEAIRALALQIGWDVRYRWQADGTSALTFYQPPRSNRTVQATFGPTEYINLPTLRISDDTVRNVVDVSYSDAATGRVQVVRYTHAGSIARFGRRYLAIDEGASSNIDTAAEASAMAVAAVSDVAFPLADQAMETFFFWPVEIHDYDEWADNGVHYDSAQRFAVVGWRHELTRQRQRTTITARGTPAGAYLAWLERAGSLREETVVEPPEIVYLTGESTPFDDVAFDDGLCHLHVTFRTGLRKIHVDVAESLTTPVPNPAAGENRRAVTLERLEGATAGADDYAPVYLIATQKGWGRRCWVYGEDEFGRLSYPAIAEAVATDGAESGPASRPANLTVTPVEGGYDVAWLYTDAFSSTWVMRNGRVVKEMPPGSTLLQDRQLPSGAPYTYKVCHYRNGKTSNWTVVGGDASGGGEPGGGVGGGGEPSGQTQEPQTLNAPAWVVGYPKGYPADDLIPDVELRFTTPNGGVPGVQYVIARSATSADDGFAPIATLTSAGASAVAHDPGAVGPGVSRYFSVQAVPPAGATGYLPSAESAHRSATYEVSTYTDPDDPTDPGQVKPGSRGD